MYTQALDLPEPGPQVASAPLLADAGDAALQAAFDAKIDAEGKIEPQDWMPTRYATGPTVRFSDAK